MLELPKTALLSPPHFQSATLIPFSIFRAAWGKFGKTRATQAFILANLKNGFLGFRKQGKLKPYFIKFMKNQRERENFDTSMGLKMSGLKKYPKGRYALFELPVREENGNYQVWNGEEWNQLRIKKGTKDIRK
jgi:hypothetical protein